MKRIIIGAATVAALLSLAPTAQADPTPAPKPPPLSAAGLGIHVPELSASGIFNGGKPFAYPPLSAGGVCHYVFRGTHCGPTP